MSGCVAIVTLGCKTNQFESAAMSEQLQQAGYRQVDFESGADLVIVNTCTVTAATDAQSRNLIRRARRLNPQARIVVTGCYAQIRPESLTALPGVALVIGNREKAELLELLARNRRPGETHVADIRAQTTLEPLRLNSFEQRSRAFVQIQNGCDAFCSYCIIPYARGGSRSVPMPEVVSQVEKFSAAGYPEIVLTGIHIGQYGRDLEPRSDLLALLKMIERSNFSGRLRLGSIEPTELSKPLYTYVAASDWICPHYHIPLQAGDDSVLARMNRHYTTGFFRDLVEKIHALSPDAAVGLDVIAGFPGESERQFENTCRLLEELPFSHLHVFPFSRRPGTPAATMPQQLAGELIRARAARLRMLGMDKNRSFQERFLGRRLELIIEGGGQAGWRKGLSRNYLPVWLADPGIRQGDLLYARISSLKKNRLIGVQDQPANGPVAGHEPRSLAAAAPHPE